jgi:hypothetical protein
MTHPITPPPELVQQWFDSNSAYADDIRRAAQWGADQELEACCLWLNGGSKIDYDTAALLRAARRPQSSLKEQALQAADRFYGLGHDKCSDEDIAEAYYTIRRALEQLND